MSSEDYDEEHYIGNRRFRKLDDGRLVELLSDGTVLENVNVGGKLIDPYSTTIEDLSDKIEHPFAEDAKYKYDDFKSKYDEGITENRKKSQSMEDIVNKAISKYGVGSQMDSGGELRIGNSMGQGKKLTGGRGRDGSEDPFKRSANRKVESFSEHLSKVKSAYKTTKGSLDSGSMKTRQLSIGKDKRKRIRSYKL